MIQTKLKVLSVQIKLKITFCPLAETEMGGRVGCKNGLTPFPEKAEWLEIAEWLCCKSVVSEPQVTERVLQVSPTPTLSPGSGWWEPSAAPSGQSLGIQPWVSPALWCRWDLCWLPRSSESCPCHLLTFGPQQSCCCHNPPSGGPHKGALGAGLDTWSWIRFWGKSSALLPTTNSLWRRRQHSLSYAMY